MKVAGTYMKNEQQMLGRCSQIVKSLIKWMYLPAGINIYHETNLIVLGHWGFSCEVHILMLIQYDCYICFKIFYILNREWNVEIYLIYFKYKVK